MSTEPELEINEYTLKILSVKMKVKFPCKMKLQHSGNSLTEQVQSKEHGRFLFNQEVTIQQPAQQPTLDFNILLVTEKGSKYVSGLVKLATCDLEKAEGQKIMAPLTKCLDPQAYCQLQINKVKVGKVPKRISVSSTLIQLKRLNSNQFNSKTPAKEEMDLLSPKAKKASGVETRSEIGFGAVGTKNGHEWEDTRSKGAAQTLIYKSSFLKSPNSKKTMAMLSPKSRLAADLNPDYELLSQRQKLTNADSQVYRQGYQKLKQKYKVQTQSLNCEVSKRQQLQANQNNYKVQIMRLKLKTEEQERIITQKNQKINQLQLAISEINRQQLDNTFLKEENLNLQEKISILNDTIHSLKKQNENLKNLYEEKQKNDKNFIEDLRLELEATKLKLETYSLQTSETIRQKTQQIISLTNQIKSKSQHIQMQRSEIYKLQAHGQTKLYQFQQTLQQQKNAGSQLANQLKQKIQVLEREKKELLKELGDIKSEKEKIKGLILKAEYDKKVLQEEAKTLRAEIGLLKGVKEEQMHLQRELVMLTQDNKNLRKQLELQAQSKEINLQELNEQYELNLDYYKKQAKQYEEKHRTAMSVKIQLQSQLESTNNLAEKQRRQLQAANNQLNSLKSTLKENKHYVQELEHRRLNLENDLVIASNKLKFGEHTYKSEIQKVRTDLERCRNELALENSKAIQLFEAKSNLETQLNKSRIQLQYNEDKIDKLFSSNKELHANIDSLNKEHDTLTQDLNEQINRLQSQLKSSQQSLHKAELIQLSSNQKLQTVRKQLKLAEERQSFLENQLKNKSEEMGQLDQKHKLLQRAFSTLEQQHSAVKHQQSVLKNDKHKVQRICELKTQEMAQLKAEYQKSQREKQSLEKIEMELRQQLKRQQQSQVKVEMKHKAVDREFNKFKQLIHRTIQTEYAKLPLLINNEQRELPQSQKRESNNTNDSRATVVLNGSAREIQITPEQVVLQTLSPSGILSQLSHSITDTKTTLFKLIEHNKQLKRQIDSLKQLSEQSSHKHQFTQIQLHREIQNIEEELHHVYDQKQDEILNYERLVSELNGKLHQKENLCEQLTQQIEELEYAISSLKLDFETNSNKNDKKQLLLKQCIRQLEDKIEFYKVSLSNQEDRNHELEERGQILKGQKQEGIEQIIKLKAMSEQACRQKQTLEQSLQEANRERKSLIEQLNQTQLQLNEQKQLKSKVEGLLSQEQKKTVELKQFISTLMKQKENIIRSELEKGDRILELETMQIELRRDLQLSAEQTLRLKSQLEQVKEKHRHQTARVKQSQTQLTQSQTKSRQLSEKLQEKEKELQMKDEIIARLNLKFRELTEKNYKETLELHSQIDSKYTENISLTRELNQKILLLEAKLEELQHTKAKLHHDNLQLNDELLAEKEHCCLMTSQNKKLEMQLQETNEEYKSLENRNSQLICQIQAREEQVTQLNDKVIVLQGEIQAINRDRQIQLQQTTLEWSAKLKSLVEQHEHKLKLVQNQRQLIRSHLQQKINQLQVCCTQSVHSELSLNDIKLNYQSKLKQVQAQTLSVTQTKNQEIKKLTEQNKLLSQQIQQLQSGLKQNSQLLENLRKRLVQEEKTKKELQIKYTSTLKLHQAQLNTLLAKQHKLNQQLETLYQTLWSNERQVRKVAQNYLKNILDHCDSEHIHKITNSSKGLEAQLVKAMTFNLSPSP